MRLFIILLFFTYGCKEKPDSSQNIITNNESKVFFKNINEGDTLISPFLIEMGVLGMDIKPAGELKAGTGHHHIILNNPFIKYGEIIPMDSNHLHYGKGDTITEMSLFPGEHSLTLQFANGMHMSYGKQYSKTINIYVK